MALQLHGKADAIKKMADAAVGGCIASRRQRSRIDEHAYSAVVVPTTINRDSKVRLLRIRHWPRAEDMGQVVVDVVPHRPGKASLAARPDDGVRSVGWTTPEAVPIAVTVHNNIRSEVVSATALGNEHPVSAVPLDPEVAL